MLKDFQRRLVNWHMLLPHLKLSVTYSVKKKPTKHLYHCGK